MTTSSDSTAPGAGSGEALQRQHQPGPGGRVLAYLGIRNRASLVLILLLAILIGLSAWTYVNVQRSLEQIRRAGMSALVETQVEAIRRWIEENLREVEGWAAHPGVVADVGRLVRASGGPGAAERLTRAPARAELSRTLEPALRGGAWAGFYVAEPSGVILASSAREQIGARAAAPLRSRLEAVFQGESRFVKPQPGGIQITGARSVAGERPVIWFEVPVRARTGDVIAALGFAEYAGVRFAHILAASRPGVTGEAFAFDDSGRMLSESRFLGELKEAGLLPRSGPASAILGVDLRDPGGPLLEGYRAEPGARPFTRLMAAVLERAGEDDLDGLPSVILEPYRNYLGMEVVGAWRWLPEFGMGVAMEMSVQEGFAPLHYFHVSLVVMIALSVAVWLAAYLSPNAWARFRGENDPQQVGPYRLRELIGEGGMSNVYLAQHAYLARPTAVKVLKPHVANDEMIARFAREVQHASQLRHPNTIRIYDYGRAYNGMFYYAMEYVDGLSLGELVERFGRMPASRVAHVLRETCASLAEMHERGLVHRDVKPHNIMVCRSAGGQEAVKVLDFGLVKDVERPDSRDLTRSVRILGTPLYMAPERIRNPADVDARADIYAVGAVAFFALTGSKLFESANDLDLTHQVLTAPPRRPSEVVGMGIPPDLDDLVWRCLAKDKAHRPANVEGLEVVLGEVLARLPWSAEEAAAWWRDHPPGFRELAGGPETGGKVRDASGPEHC